MTTIPCLLPGGRDVTRTVGRVLVAALIVVAAVACDGVRPAGSPVTPQPGRGATTALVGAATATPWRNDGVGAFRINCAISHLNYSDPIVAPGEPFASHLHSFFGNDAVDWPGDLGPPGEVLDPGQGHSRFDLGGVDRVGAGSPRHRSGRLNHQRDPRSARCVHGGRGHQLLRHRGAQRPLLDAGDPVA